MIAMNNDASVAKLRQILTENGYTVVDQANNANDCLRRVRTLRPDLVIMDQNLSNGTGGETAGVILEDGLADVMLLTSADKDIGLNKSSSDCNCVSILKPLNKYNLINMVDFMLRSKRKVKQLETEINELKQNLDTRKEVERAKGILMKQLGLSESEAFKRIQRQSMDRGIPMKEIAKAIILAYDI